jgi:hypothetical protein
LDETRVYRSGEELQPERGAASGEVFLAEEQLHPSLDEIFREIDATHRRTLEIERKHLHPARARHGAR